MRKAQLYVIDAFIAGIILFIGVGALFVAQSDTLQTQPIHSTLEDVKTLIFTTQIEELEIDYVRDNPDILEPSATVMQQVQIWLKSGCANCVDQSRDLVEDLISEVVPQQYGVYINFTDASSTETELYARIPNRIIRVTLISEQIVYSRVGSTLNGPGIVEVGILG